MSRSGRRRTLPGRAGPAADRTRHPAARSGVVGSADQRRPSEHCGVSDRQRDPGAACPASAVGVSRAGPADRSRANWTAGTWSWPELAAFCTEPGRGPYAWWRAPAWAGKSALMSWFVLHPPAGVQVVAFFITARLQRPGQPGGIHRCGAGAIGCSDGQADAELLVESRPASVICWACSLRPPGQYQRLVLVVDGLDEDQGVTAGPDAYSVAALLPTRPPAGLRVIVTGRPDPPVPDDVPDDHPLRDPDIVRVLDPSPSASVVRSDMQRELKRLLQGSWRSRTCSDW